MQIFLGLGSNLGDRESALLMKEGVLVVLQSRILETKALAGEVQPDYLNQVLECETELLPMELLSACQAVEQEMGRPLEDKGTGRSRLIDIDILFYSEEVITFPGLTIPHPRIIERSFVLAGMKELAPNFVHPVLKKTMKEL